MPARLPLRLALTAALALPVISGAAERHAFTGRFTSSYQDRPLSLRAVFTAAEGGNWDVVFYFKFAGADHAYAGTATGSLSNGELSGIVTTENGGRTFTFRGEVADGRFEGSHAEVGRGGRERRTGSLSMRG